VNLTLRLRISTLLVIVAGGSLGLSREPPAARTWWPTHVRRKQLTDVYYSEGIAAGDLNATGRSTWSMGRTGLPGLIFR
jgi:hypothetical protein